MKTIVPALLLSCCCALSAHADERAQPERRQRILDAVRPVAAARAGQPVRLRVERLNVDGGWAVLVGSLVSAGGGEPDWRLANDCDAELDKMLWVVLQRAQQTWRVKQIDICASEPPYWSLQDDAGLVWPCGVYAGLQSADGASLETQCRRTPRRK